MEEPQGAGTQTYEEGVLLSTNTLSKRNNLEELRLKSKEALAAVASASEGARLRRLHKKLEVETQCCCQGEIPLLVRH